MPMMARLSLVDLKWPLAPSIAPGSSLVRKVSHICLLPMPLPSLSSVGCSDSQSV